ncbi:MAG TPA: DUF4142 domain-containing protein [Verrucomicrobiae bacterium]|jgi:putative membrane protein|nr:DUF4142 domain-containing protein [Verrucomicrobiae bacterium]
MKAIDFKKLVIAAAFCAVAIPAVADDMMMTNGPAAAAITPADFAWDAGLINLEEIRLGEAAQSNSQNTAVQNFGRRMVKDHSKLNDRLTKIAADEGLQLPETNTFYIHVTPPEEKPATGLMQETPREKLLNAQLDVQHLLSLTGPEFDRAYADAMVKGHQKAVQEFENASGALQDKPLQHYANKGSKIIQHHYEMAQQLQSEVEQGTNAPANTTPM